MVEDREVLDDARGAVARARDSILTHAAFGEGAPEFELIGAAGMDAVGLEDGVASFEEGGVGGQSAMPSTTSWRTS